tara:strand:- start:75 stop:713 length:639 start_codon:yes stop_codon:yes gene_type:complete
MTAREEDILTSANLIKKGIAIDKLLDSLIVTEGIKIDDLILGDKNAVMVAARVLAYGPEYVCDITVPITGENIKHTFNLADCPFREIPDGINGNSFSIDLPISKKTIEFKLLTGKEEKLIDEELKASKKTGSDISPELTTRLRHVILSVDGETDASTINKFVQTMLARDSLTLRKEINRIAPDIEMKQNVEVGGEVVEVDIPLTTEFFWPST